jgi:hypothetical protein
MVHIERKGWTYDEERNWWILTAILKKDKFGQRTRQVNAIILHLDTGTWMLFEPSRELSYQERKEQQLFVDVEDAKQLAEKQFEDYLDDIKADRVNWWTRKRKEAEEA